MHRALPACRRHLVRCSQEQRNPCRQCEHWRTFADGASRPRLRAL